MTAAAGGDISVLVLGASGMLGHTLFTHLARTPGMAVTGTVRSERSAGLLPRGLRGRLVTGVDVENHDALATLLSSTHPNVVVNCVGLVKQLMSVEDPLVAIPINSMHPHRLSRLCELSGSRMIHFSTDCVFSGRKGMYKEEDFSDATDLYGRTKYLGEVTAPHAITLRTSIIGHELQSAHGLVGWFLSQKDRVKGYRKFIFSGLPTIEVAHVISDYIIPNPDLTGVYHLAGPPISKFDLLTLVAARYQKQIEIIPDDAVAVDRSLNADRFRAATGYSPPDWTELVRRMWKFHTQNRQDA